MGIAFLLQWVVQWIAFFVRLLFSGLHSLWCCSVDRILCDVLCVLIILMSLFGWQVIVICQTCVCCILQGVFSVDCILCDVLCVLFILMSLFGWQDIVICGTCVCCILGVLLSGLHSLWCVVQLIASRSPSPTWTLRAPRAVTTTTWGCSVEMTPMPQSWVATAAWLFPRPSHPQAPASSSSSCQTQSRRKQASALCTHDPLPVSAVGSGGTCGYVDNAQVFPFAGVL